MGTDTPIIRSCSKHREVNGMELVKAMDGLFMNQKFFIAAINTRLEKKKSRQYLETLFEPGWHRVSKEIADAIVDVISRK